MKKYIITTVIISILLFTAPIFAQAQTLQIVPACALGDNTPQLSCFLDLAKNVFDFIIALTGSLALLYFVYGGVRLLISRGNETEITKGKEILSHAIIGVIIIFGAYLMVDFLTNTVLKATIPKIQDTPTEPDSNTKAVAGEQFTCYCTIRSTTGGSTNDSPVSTKSYDTSGACNTACTKNFCETSHSIQKGPAADKFIIGQGCKTEKKQ